MIDADAIDAHFDVASATVPHRTALLATLSLGGFAIGTSEFSMMGLMPDVATAFGVSESQVGHLISAYALGVVVGAPCSRCVTGICHVALLLVWLMAFYPVANFATAMAPGYGVMIASRFIAGLPHGAYFGVAVLTAVAITPKGARGRAVSLVMLGLILAILLGNLIATWMGQHIGWHWAFVLVGSIALITTGLLAGLMPHERVHAPVRAMDELRVQSSAGLAGVGHRRDRLRRIVCVFSYLALTLLKVTRVGRNWIPIGLAGFGVGGVIGSIAVGWLFDRLRFRAVPLILLGAAVVLLLFPLAAHALWSILLATVAVGLIGALGPVLQSNLMDVAGKAQTLAAASHHAAFNAANSLGPWLGGLAIDAGLGWTSTGYVGAATALLGLAIYYRAAATLRRVPAPCRASCSAT